jgi:hypothetical protein
LRPRYLAFSSTRRRPAERQPLVRPLASRRLEALRSAGPTGPDPRLSPAQLTAIEQVTGVGYHPGHTWKRLRRMGWRLQRPARRAVERDEQAIARWLAEDWPSDLPQRPPASRGFLGGQKATLVWDGLLWANLKGVELATWPPTPSTTSLRRPSAASNASAPPMGLAYSLPRHCGLSLW